MGRRRRRRGGGRGPGCVVSAAAVHVCVRVWCFVSSAAAAAAAVLWFFVYYFRKRSFKRAHISERALCSAMARGHGVRCQSRSACRALRCTCRAPGRGTCSVTRNAQHAVQCGPIADSLRSAACNTQHTVCAAQVEGTLTSHFEGPPPHSQVDT